MKLIVSKVCTFHENIELLPSGDCYDLSPGNNAPIEHIIIALVGTPVKNQPDLVKVAKED